MKRYFHFLISITLFFSPASAFSAGPDQSKSETRKDVDAALDRIEDQIQSLETKSKALSADARAEWQSAIDELKNSGRKLRAEIKEERAAGENKAKDFWSRMKAAIGELQAGVEAAGKKLKGDKAEK